MRGAFIVVEGCDRSGKTTQCKHIVSALNKKKIKAEYMNFPDRSTTIGKVIDDYLSKRVELPDKAIHLLFSANRWELEPEIKAQLSEGITLIVDRYSYSGVVYSAVKPGMEIDWCKNPDSGLPKPDLVLYLSLTQEEINKRSGFGDERYEKSTIQEAVSESFKEMEGPNWKIIDSNKSESDLTAELLPLVIDTIEASKEKPISELCGEELPTTCCQGQENISNASCS